MKRILLTIEYDGTNYSGWQKQPNVRTIQGEIEKAIFNSIGQEVEIFGSGRTDAKVHALNQKAHFDLAVPVPVSKLADIINNCLPDDIVIKEAVEVDENFHARFSLIRKCYRYKIYNSEQKNAFLANRVGYVRRKLDISKMRQASSLLIGEHNFRGFCSSNTCAENFVRTIYDIKIAFELEGWYNKPSYVGFLGKPTAAFDAAGKMRAFYRWVSFIIKAGCCTTEKAALRLAVCLRRQFDGIISTGDTGWVSGDFGVDHGRRKIVAPSGPSLNPTGRSVPAGKQRYHL